MNLWLKVFGLISYRSYTQREKWGEGFTWVIDYQDNWWKKHEFPSWEIQLQWLWQETQNIAHLWFISSSLGFTVLSVATLLLITWYKHIAFPYSHCWSKVYSLQIWIGNSMLYEKGVAASQIWVQFGFSHFLDMRAEERYCLFTFPNMHLLNWLRKHLYITELLWEINTGIFVSLLSPLQVLTSWSEHNTQHFSVYTK